ncbi:MAG: hypothetical protein OXH09_22530 [Gammaproteobacteria bacterium]|nr:hypothetical protein [Gammaproteobacteria bacterium]
MPKQSNNFHCVGQLERDVAPLLPAGTPVWLRAEQRVLPGGASCRVLPGAGWDYSVSVTDPRKRVPVLDGIDDQPDAAWTHIGLGEEAVVMRHRPAGWEAEQSYVVVRRLHESGQGQLFPAYTVILVSRDDLPVDEPVRRHRGKQGHQNAFKGPLIDLDLHHPPYRRFRANQAFYVCGQLSVAPSCVSVSRRNVEDHVGHTSYAGFLFVCNIHACGVPTPLVDNAHFQCGEHT